MKFKNYIVLLAGCLLLSVSSFAYKTPGNERPNDGTTPSGVPISNLRSDCVASSSQIDQAINNVRARLLAGGDVWWDGDDGRYVVPKVEPGQTEVSSIFAGAVWLGGVDAGGNLKVAAQTYGTSGGSTDFWSGPLNMTGETEADLCETWDRFFTVSGTDVRQHAANFAKAQEEGTPYNPDDIPESVRGWPALGNEHFEDVHGFRLPFDEINALAGFWDYGDNGVPDGVYNPELGDFPIVEIRGCNGFPVTFPDEMIFWIYNDNGNIHTESNGDAIRMEVQVQAFAFQSDDEINNMTFQRYKLINRAIEPITETFFAMWVDGDLGCYDDDYIGCDTTRSLAFYYNQDAVDGNADGSCAGGVPTYGSDVPGLGVDYFRGPLDENFEEIGMSSFTYYNNNGVGGPWPAGTTDPGNAAEYYNYLSGNWRDGTPYTLGGSGYDPGNPDVVRYAFVDTPDLSGGWSMCEEQSPSGDRRTIQASGPFTLLPGAKNELIIGVVWLEELIYPCPNINSLLLIDDVAQALFDNCFELTRGPSAPDLDFIELDRELICVLSNDPGNPDNNNVYENYAERDLRAPSNVPDDDTTYFYTFEGYQIYQLAGPTASNLDDPEQARLIREMDLKNGVSKVFNWEPVTNPLDPANSVWTPVQKADGLDEDVQHTFSINEDQFAAGDRTLINHKTYYFTAIAYGYNNWEDFRVELGAPLGQRSPYISGDLNIRTYTPVPRPINDQQLNTFYGEGVQLERLEGDGTGGYFVELTDETIDAIFDGNVETLVYKKGQGPVQVQITNPLEVVDGNYELRFQDSSPDDDDLSKFATWTLTNLDTGDEYFGEKRIEFNYEQIIQEVGLSITARTPETVGENATAANGAVGAEIEYAEGGINAWFAGAPGNTQNANFIATGPPEDLFNGLTGTNMSPNFFVPFILATPPNANNVSPQIDDNTIYTLTKTVSKLTDLNNVNIVFTKDKSKWSRCMVIETSPRDVSDANQANWATENGADHFNTRRSPSVGKDVDGDGNPVAATGAPSDMGFGWFPGYAIDVDSGKRLNIFFGEASSYDCAALTAAGLQDFCSEFLNGENGTGRDMMWNPTPQVLLNTPLMSIANAIAGGHHWVYVTRTEYDECESLYEAFNSNNPIQRRNGLAQITWTSAAVPFVDLNSYADGLIPEDLVYKIRVSKPLGVDKSTAVENDGYPLYRFKIEDKEAKDLTSGEEFDEQLAEINMVPNPYYGFSDYEQTATSTRVKITNLPNQCTVNIFSLEGKYIRSYSRNVGSNEDLALGGINARQATASLDWDLKNSKGIPVASGTYLVNINAPGIGERTLKLFLVQRQFDPSGL